MLSINSSKLSFFTIHPADAKQFKSSYHLKDKAIQQICKDKNVKLILVGPREDDLDPLKPETLEEVKNNKKIIPVGFQKDVRPYFAISDALTFPSYREGFPNVVMQAGAMGLPSIVSNINGCNEIIINEENGIIIPSKDVSSLKTAMTTLLSDKKLYQSLKDNSREMIVPRYNQIVIWNSLLKEYQELISKLGG